MKARTQRFLLKCKENGIQKFYVFDVIVDDIVEFHTLFNASDAIIQRQEWGSTYGSPRCRVAHSVEQPMPPHDRGNLFYHEREQESASSTQNDVMKLEEELHLERLLICHDSFQAEDDDQVRDESRYDAVCGRQRGLAGLIVGEVYRNTWEGDIGEKEVGEGSHDGGRRRKPEENDGRTR